MATAHRAVGGRRAMVSNRALTFRVGIANYMGFKRQQDEVQRARVEGCCMLVDDSDGVVSALLSALRVSAYVPFV